MFRPCHGCLFKLDRLVPAVVINRPSPYFVRGLVFGAAITESGSKTHVEIAHSLQDVDELLGIELRYSTFKSLDQDVCRDVALERYVIRRLTGKIFGKGIFVFESHTRVTGNRRDHLSHDYAGGIARSQ